MGIVKLNRKDKIMESVLYVMGIVIVSFYMFLTRVNENTHS